MSVQSDSTAPAPPAGRVPRPVWVAALLWGMQFAFLMPSIALVLVSLFRATAGQVGTATMVQNLAGLAFSFLIPAWADRTGRYVGAMGFCGLLTVALAASLWFAPGLLWAAAGLVVLGAPAAVGNALYFAHLQTLGIDRRRMMDVRAVVSFAWVVGMPLSAVMVGAWGARSLVLAFGVLGVANLAVTRWLGTVPSLGRPTRGGDEQDRAPVRWRLVAVMALLYVALQATNAAAVPVTPLLVSQHLHLPVSWSGTALGVAAALEIPSLVLLGRLEHRVGPNRLLTSGILAGIGYYAAVAHLHQPWLLVAAQVPNAWFVAVVSGIGLTWFQEAIPRAGLAAGLFTNTRRVGAIASGPMIAYAQVSPQGYAGVFALSAWVCLACLAVPTLLALWRRRGSWGRRRPR